MTACTVSTSRTLSSCRQCTKRASSTMGLRMTSKGQNRPCSSIRKDYEYSQKSTRCSGTWRTMRTAYSPSSGCSFSMKKNSKSTSNKRSRGGCRIANSRDCCSSNRVGSHLEAGALTIHQKRSLKQADASNPRVLPSSTVINLSMNLSFPSKTSYPL